MPSLFDIIEKKKKKHEENLDASEKERLKKEKEQMERKKEAIKKIILKKYMPGTEEEVEEVVENEGGEKEFDNMGYVAKSPPARSPQMNSKKLANTEWELSSPRTHIDGRWQRMSLVLTCCYSLKLWTSAYMQFLEHGGWFFFIPILLAIFMFGCPLVFLELALGQYTSQQSTLIYSRMAPIASGITFIMMIYRFVLVMGHRTEHSFLLHLLQQLRLVFFKDLSKLCGTRTRRKCRVNDECVQRGSSFYKGSCYDAENLLQENRITREGYVQLKANELIYQFSEQEEYAMVEDGSEIFSLQGNPYRVVSIVFLFLIFFAGTKLGIKKVAKCLPLGILLTVVVFLTTIICFLAYDNLREQIPFFFKFMTFHSDISRLEYPEAWYDGLIIALTLLSIGDGTLHALGAMNQFSANIFKDSLSLCVSAAVSLFICVIFFGTIGITGADVYAREFLDETVTLENAHEFIKNHFGLRRHIHLLYYFGTINRFCQVVIILLFMVLTVLQIAPHVLLAENILTVVVRLNHSFADISSKIYRHCVFLIYYLALGIFYFLNMLFLDVSEMVGGMLQSLCLLNVAWQCFAIHSTYGMQRFLVNIYSMFRSQPKMKNWALFLSRPAYFLWTIFYPIAYVSMWSSFFVNTISIFRGNIAIYLHFIIAICPILVSIRQIAKARVNNRLQYLIRPHSSWGPFTVKDKKDARFDELAARITF